MIEAQSKCGQGAAEDVNHGGHFPLSIDDWRAIGGSLKFSVRELQVVQCVFEGGTEADIAVQLGLSSHTIHSYLDRLYKKLHVNSRCELAVRVFEAYLTMHDGNGHGNGSSISKPDRPA